MADWAEITDRLIQNEHNLALFMETLEFAQAFEKWAIETMPEEYGND